MFLINGSILTPPNLNFKFTHGREKNLRSTQILDTIYDQLDSIIYKSMKRSKSGNDDKASVTMKRACRARMKNAGIYLTHTHTHTITRLYI